MRFMGKQTYLGIDGKKDSQVDRQIDRQIDRQMRKGKPRMFSTGNPVLTGDRRQVLSWREKSTQTSRQPDNQTLQAVGKH